MRSEGKSAPGRAVKGDRPTDERVSTALAALTEMDRDALRGRWKELNRTSAPDHLPKWLLARVLAYRIQAQAYGDLDQASIRFLDKIADERERRSLAGEKLNKKPPRIPPVPPRPLKPGTTLIREHDRKMHHVVVVQDGFSWNGGNYRSLSEVAFAITGTRWNGPRFFGLRARRDQPGAPE